MPNRRRRKLSTALSGVAALAVASPFAVIALSEMVPVAEQHEFEQAAVVTDLPNEIISALSQGLSQFGINLPPMPTGLSPAGAMPATGPGLLTNPAVTTAPGLTPGLTTAPGLTSPGLTTPGLTTPPLTPGLTTPSLTPGLTDATGLGIPDPALTSPIAGVPDLGTGLNPALTSPDPLAPTLGAAPGLGIPGEVPIAAPIGLDPMAGTYPILGDPSLAAVPSTGGGGLISDLSSAAQQLGAGQAIDLLKGVVMPSIMSAVQSAAPAAQGAAAPAVGAAEAATGAAEAATGAAAGAAQAATGAAAAAVS